ncbi:MAG: MFS transporter [Steroidobacteraceae bacterium]
MPSPPARSEFAGQIGPLIASVLGLACGIATLGLPYSIGVVLKPLQAQFGWSTQEIMTVQPVVTVAVVIMSIVIGILVDRIGARIPVLISQASFGIGLILLGALTQSLTDFYLIYFLMAFASGGTLAVPFTRLLAARFDRNRGLALGIALSGTGVASFVFQPYFAWVVEHHGWRVGYYAIAALPLCLALPASFLWLHDSPQRGGVERRAVAGHSLLAAMRDYRFWIMCVGFFAYSGAITGVLNNFPPILIEKGFAPVSAASIAGSFGLAVIIGRIGVGMLVDRYWAPAVAFSFFLPSALGLWLLSGAPQPLVVTVGLIVLAGLAAGAEVDLMAYMASRYFGVREFGRIYGALFVAFALGPGVLVPAFAAMRDWTGSYTPGLRIVASCILGVALLFLLLGRYPDAYRGADDGSRLR